MMCSGPDYYRFRDGYSSEGRVILMRLTVGFIIIVAQRRPVFSGLLWAPKGHYYVKSRPQQLQWSNNYNEADSSSLWTYKAVRVPFLYLSSSAQEPSCTKLQGSQSERTWSVLIMRADRIVGACETNNRATSEGTLIITVFVRGASCIKPCY